MARSFPGDGFSDIIVTGLTTQPTLRSYHIWTYRTGDGGGPGFGRMFEKNNGGGGSEALTNVSPDYQFSSTWSSGQASWTFTRPSASAYHGIGISRDTSATTNIPKAYVDGSNVSVTETTSPVGTIVTSSDAYTIGNRQSDQARCWDGNLAEFGVWDAILDASEFAALGNGVSPLLIRPQSLVCYLPMIRDNVDLKIGGTPTLSGTTVSEQPRVFYPSVQRTLRWSGGGAAPDTLFAQTCL